MLLCVWTDGENPFLPEYQAHALLEPFVLQLIYRGHRLPRTLHVKHKLNGSRSTLSLMMEKNFDILLSNVTRNVRQVIMQQKTAVFKETK